MYKSHFHRHTLRHLRNTPTSRWVVPVILLGLCAGASACSAPSEPAPPQIQAPPPALEEGLVAVSEVVVESYETLGDGSLTVSVFLLDCQGLAEVRPSPVRVWAGFRPGEPCGERVSLRTVTLSPQDV